ncbi:hypothetical protein DCF50_p2060 [Dehalobacter sp. CF]|nr:hypothetical protein DCF50_p2060 [Dehalobacter sp. CF]
MLSARYHAGPKNASIGRIFFTAVQGPSSDESFIIGAEGGT